MLLPNIFQELKLRKSQQLLVEIHVGKILSFLVFQSTEYFSLSSRKRTGLTPLEYRRPGENRIAA